MFRGIVGNITVLFTLLTLGLVAGMAVIDGIVVSRQLVESTGVELQALAREKQSALSSWRRQMLGQAAGLARNPLLAQIDLLSDPATPADRAVQLRQAMTNWLNGVLLVTDFSGYTVLDGKSGKVLFTSLASSADPLSQSGEGLGGQHLFQMALHKPSLGVLRLGIGDNAPTAAIAVPIQAGDTAQGNSGGDAASGILMLYTSFSAAETLIQSRAGDPAGLQSYLLTADRRLATKLPGLTDADLLARIDDEPAAHACAAGRSGIISAPDYHNVASVVAYRWMPNTGFCLVTSIPHDVATAAAWQFEEYIFLASFCLFWLGGLVSMIFGRRVASPILAIAAAVRGVARGRRGIRLPEGRSDELGDVAKGFNQMAEALERREEELERSRTALSTTVTHIDQGLTRFDANFTLIFFNRRFRDIFGLDEAWLASRPSFQEIFARCAASGLIGVMEQERLNLWAQQFLRAPEREFGALRFTDQRVIDVRHDPVPEGGVVLTFSNVTVLNRQQEELRAARDAAERANRAKSDFLAAMSHELRTPLNAILGFSQLLQIDKFGNLNPRQAEFVALVIQSGEHLLGLISDMLELSKIEAGRVNVTIEQIEPATVIKAVRATLEPMAGQRKVKILAGDDGVDAPAVLADRKRLMQVLANLGTNAIKYNRQNGTVAFEVTHRPGEWVRISVVDTGMGIPTERQGELFKPFSRLGAEQGNVEGTGIGLNITRQLVDLMGGKLGFSSTPGFGSRFWVDLLPAPPEAAQLGKSMAEAKRPLVPSALTMDSTGAVRTGQPLSHFEVTVLYVEDNPVSRELMRNVMEFMSDARLLEAENGGKALEMAKTEQPDLIVLDIELPDMDGYTVLRRLNEEPATANIPVVALTRAGFIEDAERLGNANFRLYLTKPLQIPRLLEVVKAIAREKAFTPV
ncbi:MAG TPA: ATP-binding protein [Stellaceae bacterium]|nr:ATP-binding protein [Stellaceae bacterium]